MSTAISVVDRRWLITIVVVVGSLALAPVAAAKRDAEPRPDFTVTKVSIREVQEGALPYILQTEFDLGVDVQIKVKNIGDAAARGAGKLTVLGNGLLRATRIVFKVPRLKPDRSKVIDVEVKESDVSGITQYTTKAGASTRKDSNTRNDFRRGPPFAVIPRTWVGSANATLFDGFVTQSVVANNVTFKFQEASASKEVFLWRPIGSVTATITSDTDPDCDYSGTGDFAIDPAKASLVLTADLFNYRAASLDTGSYPATANCTTVGRVPYDQAVGPWIEMDMKSRDATDEDIVGTYANGLGDSWSWSLIAE